MNYLEKEKEMGKCILYLGLSGPNTDARDRLDWEAACLSRSGASYNLCRQNLKVFKQYFWPERNYWQRGQSLPV
jgi:hypothetical protein